MRYTVSEPVQFHESSLFISPLELAPEPHVLLFRRLKNFDEQLRQQQAEMQLGGGKAGRKK